MKKFIHLKVALILMSILLTACNTGESSGKTRKEKTNVQKVFSKTGVLISEITMKGDVRHGPTKNYYESGKVQSVINFENGQQQGESVWYYEDGLPYQVTTYINDKKEGIQRKYYKSGKILAEVPFYNDEQKPGMKEYTETGELITDYPEIIFEKPQKASPSGQFILRMHLSDNSKIVAYEQVVVNVPGDTVLAKVNTIEGVGEIPFYVEKGKTIAVQVYIRAKMRTKLKNIYIAEKQHYVRISN